MHVANIELSIGHIRSAAPSPNFNASACFSAGVRVLCALLSIAILCALLSIAIAIGIVMHCHCYWHCYALPLLLALLCIAIAMRVVIHCHCYWRCYPLPFCARCLCISLPISTLDLLLVHVCCLYLNFLIHLRTIDCAVIIAHARDRDRNHIL
jgi:hypothetical protein